MGSQKQSPPRAAVAAAILVSLIGGCSERSATPNKTEAPAAIADIATAYTSYQKVTDEEVRVSPQLATLCDAPPAQQWVETFRRSPHANAAILVYMNEPAAQVFSRGNNVYPVGSVIVKEKRIMDFSGKKSASAGNGVGGMVKRAAGYDPAHGDWEYFYFEDRSNIQAGRIQSCVQCHEGAKDKDYVFGTWRTTPATRVSAAAQ